MLCTAEVQQQQVSRCFNSKPFEISSFVQRVSRFLACVWSSQTVACRQVGPNTRHHSDCTPIYILRSGVGMLGLWGLYSVGSFLWAPRCAAQLRLRHVPLCTKVLSYQVCVVSHPPRSMVTCKMAAPVTGTSLRTTGPVPADSRQ